MKRDPSAQAAPGASTPATIAQVATAAGVSRATVSRVMNGRATVAPLIAERVRQAVRELDYTPSTVARSLSLGRTNTVALVVPDLGNPMFQQVLRGVTQAAAVDGYRVLVADSAENVDEEQLLAIEARMRCDALVLCAPRMPIAQLTELLPRVSPTVVINRDLGALAAPALSIDYGSGIKGLMSHLLELGHTRFLFLGGPEQSASNQERLDGLRAVSAAHPEITIDTVTCGAAIEDGYAAASAVLSNGATAVLAFNDLVAVGLLGRLAELEVPVPGRISVTGFDDIQFARFATPSLTTMSVPQMELGRQAWAQLRELLEGGQPEHAVFFRPRLEVRSSTGPAPAVSVGLDGAGEVADA
jgi:LacI family transcriptional regulator